jgi:hypothetical protein
LNGTLLDSETGGHTLTTSEYKRETGSGDVNHDKTLSRTIAATLLALVTPTAMTASRPLAYSVYASRRAGTNTTKRTDGTKVALEGDKKSRWKVKLTTLFVDSPGVASDDNDTPDIAGDDDSSDAYKADSELVLSVMYRPSGEVTHTPSQLRTHQAAKKRHNGAHGGLEKGVVERERERERESV